MNSPMQILIVEDNQSDRQLLRYLLEDRFPKEVVTFHEAGRLEDALKILNQGAISCVILDLQLPDSTGPQTFQRVFELHWGIPIIVMTHNKNRQLAIDMIQAGASDYIIKNFTNEEELFNRIVLAIERHEAQRKASETSDGGFQDAVLKKLDSQALETQALQTQLNQLRQQFSDPPLSLDDDPKKITLGQKAAESVARVVGSWTFILVQSTIILIWVVINNLPGFPHWDGYPFILMNLVLSLQAAYTAPMIMMAQNRVSQKDRLIARTDYEISHQDLQINRQTQATVQVLQGQVEQQAAKLDLILNKINKRPRLSSTGDYK
jgi:uncharacterized membrane protein/ActR/RegA family two-component response regulator